MKIYETTNYSMFELHEFNRDLHDTTALEQSMKTHGFLNDCPIAVKKENGKFKIVRGHHRFHVAKKLKIPVKYVLENAKVAPSEIEGTLRCWTLGDFLGSFARTGVAAYVEVKKFHKDTGIPLNSCISMLGGQSASSGNYTKVFKRGTFAIKDRTHADAVAEIVLLMVTHGIKWANTSLMVRALSKILSSGHVDIKRLKTKIKCFHSLIEKQPNLERYLDMLEDIYNRQSHDKIPLAFLASEAAKKRQQSFGKI